MKLVMGNKAVEIDADGDQAVLTVSEDNDGRLQSISVPMSKIETRVPAKGLDKQARSLKVVAEGESIQA